MRRHQPREAGPDTRNTGPRGRGTRSTSPKGPRPAPRGPTPRRDKAGSPPRLVGDPHAPLHNSQARELGGHLQGLSNPRCPMENKAQCRPPRSRAAPGTRDAWQPSTQSRRTRWGATLCISSAPPAHPNATSLLPAPSLGSWSSPKFPGAPEHAGRSVGGAPRSPAGHPPRAPTRECRGPANSAACAA